MASINNKISRKVTFGAAGLTAISVCDKGLAALICITVIAFTGILMQGLIDYKAGNKSDNKITNSFSEDTE